MIKKVFFKLIERFQTGELGEDAAQSASLLMPTEGGFLSENTTLTYFLFPHVDSTVWTATAGRYDEMDWRETRTTSEA